MCLRCRGEQQHLAIRIVGKSCHLRRVVEPDCRRRIRRPQTARFAQPNLCRLIVGQSQRDYRCLELNQWVSAATGGKCPLDNQSRLLELAELLIGERKIVQKSCLVRRVRRGGHESIDRPGPFFLAECNQPDMKGRYGIGCFLDQRAELTERFVVHSRSVQCTRQLAALQGACISRQRGRRPLPSDRQQEVCIEQAV